ncbi:type II toxin-antitoxin system PemK/MazF family toxin [Clostridium botulinum]|nr:type II toxin-antitoxin system PemK/MazF family toxin [Clostridium botulinum]
MMNFGRVKAKRIYVIQFNPVKDNEFDNQHLGLVLKKNNDGKTCIVMPLTSEGNGEGTNKINIGKIPTLPSNLNVTDSYAVYNQVRTVNVERFKPLKDNNVYVDSYIDDKLFLKLLDLGTSELLYELDFDEKISLHKSQYEKACIAKMIDLTYTIIKLHKAVTKLIETDLQGKLINQKKSEISSIETKIKDILSMGIEYTLTEKQINDGLKIILDNLSK